MAATVVALPTLVDLVGPTPEEPQMNHQVLQTLLHVMVQQLGLNKTRVEFRGPESDQIKELMKKTEGHTMELRIIQDKVAKEEESENIISDVTKVDSKDKKLQDTEVSYIIESGEIVVTEKKRTNQVSLTTFNRLEGKVKSLQAQVESLGIQVLPSDEALLSKTRSADRATPISDLLQAMNITKRMSGAEEGIDKLGSLLETVAKEYADLKLLLDKVQDELGLDVVETMKEIKLAADYAKKMRPRAELYEKALIKRDKSSKGAGSTTEITDYDIPATAPKSSIVSSAGSVESGISKPKTSTQDYSEKDLDFDNLISEEDKVSIVRDPGYAVSDIVDDYDKFAMLPTTNAEAVKINNLIMDQELIRRQMEFMTAQINTLADFSEKILPEILEGLPGMEELKKKVASIRGKTGSQVTLTTADWEIKRSTLTTEQRVEDLESKVASHSSKLRRQDALFCDKYETVLNTVREMQGSIANIRAKLNIDGPAGGSENLLDPNNIKIIIEKNNELSEELQEMVEEINQIKDKILKNEHDLVAVSDEIEGIHSTKVDRFEIDDILADKADCSEVQNKVSSDIFEEFCNSLTKGVDFAIKSSVEQEQHLKKELEKLLVELDKKFDKLEVDELKCEIYKHIQELNCKLDQVARMKDYTMASASKKKLFTEVNCVACDKKAVMETEENACDKPATKSFVNPKPYITVELEQLKKLRIKNPEAKNMLLHEQIMKNYAMSVGFDLLPEHDINFVNRYCGGAETLMNPRQRVSKVPRNSTSSKLSN